MASLSPRSLTGGKRDSAHSHFYCWLNGKRTMPFRMFIVHVKSDLISPGGSPGAKWGGDAVWQIELFFRWLKCVLGCRHLLSHSQQGVTLQVYFAIIASLLIGLWTGTKPNKRLYEMICLYFAGWATAEELSHHIEKNATKQKQPP